MLEGTMIVAGELAPTARRATPRIDPALRRARTLRPYRRRTRRRDRRWAGEVAVIDLTMDGAAVTETGRAALQAAGVPPRASEQAGLLPSLPRLERAQAHIAGQLGAALLDRAMTTGLVRRRKGCRVLDVADGGEIDVLCRLGSARSLADPFLALRTEAALGHWSFENAEFCNRA